MVVSRREKTIKTGLFKILGTNEHKAEYAYSYAIEKDFTHYQAKRLVAQIHQENGTWDETRRGDLIAGVWCSVGLTQWNECARGPVPHKDWQGQIRMLIDEVKGKYYGDNFDQALVSWNKPAVMRSGSYKTVYYYKNLKIYDTLFKK